MAVVAGIAGFFTVGLSSIGRWRGRATGLDRRYDEFLGNVDGVPPREGPPSGEGPPPGEGPPSGGADLESHEPRLGGAP